MKKIAIALVTIAVLTPQLRAQAIYAGVRGGAGIPTGEFADQTTATGDASLLHGATPGLGYGFEAGLGSTLLGLYGSYDRVDFDCQSSSCKTSGKYSLKGMSAGVRVSVPLLPLLKPFAKAGITYNEMTGDASGVEITAKKAAGYELGAGVEIPVLAGFFSLTPQIRRITQKLRPVAATSSATTGPKRSADYYNFSLGLNVRTPF